MELGQSALRVQLEIADSFRRGPLESHTGLTAEQRETAMHGGFGQTFARAVLYYYIQRGMVTDRVYVTRRV